MTRDGSERLRRVVEELDLGPGDRHAARGHSAGDGGMSATQYYVAQSLDGYIAERDGGLDWLLSYGASEAEVAEATDGSYERFFSEVGAVAMGSATYEFLLDELLLTIVPVWLGDGLPTFARRLESRLRLTGAHPFANGMTELRYAIER